MTARKKRGPSAKVMAEINAIIQHVPRYPSADWISGEGLAEKTGLSVAQVMHRVALMRDLIPDAPLVSGPQGYQFTIAEKPVATFHNAAVRTAHTRMRRSWNGVMKPFIQRTAEPTVARVLTKQFERILEDIGEMVG